MAAVASPLPDPAAERAALLYERHHGAVLGYCVWRLRRRDDAEEATQTTFTRALGALRRGHVPRNERAWLVTIARNVCTTLGTAPHRAREIVGEVPDGVEREADHGLDPELESALAALPEGQRRALLLREWQELSYREIAAELGVSVSTVESWIFRARRSLAVTLDHTRRRLGLVWLVRPLVPSAGAKVAATAVLATAVVAAEQAVVPHGSTGKTVPAPSVGLAVAPTPASHATASRRITPPRRARHVPVRDRATRPALPVGVDVARGAAASGAAVPSPAPEPKGDGATVMTPPDEPQPALAPAVPALQTPELPVSTPTLPPVETPTVPDLPAPPPVALPPLPNAGDLPVDAPTLP